MSDNVPDAQLQKKLKRLEELETKQELRKKNQEKQQLNLKKFQKLIKNIDKNSLRGVINCGRAVRSQMYIKPTGMNQEKKYQSFIPEPKKDKPKQDSDQKNQLSSGNTKSSLQSLSSRQLYQHIEKNPIKYTDNPERPISGIFLPQPRQRKQIRQVQEELSSSSSSNSSRTQNQTKSSFSNPQLQQNNDDLFPQIRSKIVSSQIYVPRQYEQKQILQQDQILDSSLYWNFQKDNPVLNNSQQLQPQQSSLLQQIQPEHQNNQPGQIYFARAYQELQKLGYFEQLDFKIIETICCELSGNIRLGALMIYLGLVLSVQNYICYEMLAESWKGIAWFLENVVDYLKKIGMSIWEMLKEFWEDLLMSS